MQCTLRSARCLFLSPVFGETNVSKFSVAFIHKLLHNAGKNSVKMKEKNRLKTKEKRAKQNDKIQKTFLAVFAEYEFD